MKRILLDFFRRGIVSCGIGPVVLAVLYLILERSAGLESLSATQVATGIFSITALAFVAGGMNAVYQIERLPLMVAVLIHGAVLYVGYLVTYLINDWLEWGTAPILVFSAIFVVGYIGIWVVIHSIVKKNTKKINDILEKKRSELPLRNTYPFKKESAAKTFFSEKANFIAVISSSEQSGSDG